MATTTSTLASLSAADQAPEQVHGPVTRSDLVRYAGAGGDFNPIHHDEQFARDAGLDTVFAMGMLHAGLLSRLVAGWLDPAHFIRVHRSVVIATRAIRDLEPAGHGEYEIHLQSGVCVTSGRTYHAQIRKLTQNPVGRS